MYHFFATVHIDRPVLEDKRLGDVATRWPRPLLDEPFAAAAGTTACVEHTPAHRRERAEARLFPVREVRAPLDLCDGSPPPSRHTSRPASHGPRRRAHGGGSGSRAITPSNWPYVK